MAESNPLREKSYVFSLDIIDAYEILIEEKEYILGKQLLKSGTSIGANIEEALQGQASERIDACYSGCSS